MVRNEKGFTLIEMLIVMLIISVLLIITIPNVVATNEKIQNKGCEAYMQMVQGQIQLYELEKNTKVTDFSLLVPEYLPEGSNACPNGQLLQIDNSKVTLLQQNNVSAGSNLP